MTILHPLTTCKGREHIALVVLMLLLIQATTASANSQHQNQTDNTVQPCIHVVHAAVFPPITTYYYFYYNY